MGTDIINVSPELVLARKERQDILASIGTMEIKKAEDLPIVSGFIARLSKFVKACDEWRLKVNEPYQETIKINNADFKAEAGMAQTALDKLERERTDWLRKQEEKRRKEQERLNEFARQQAEVIRVKAEELAKQQAEALAAGGDAQERPFGEELPLPLFANGIDPNAEKAAQIPEVIPKMAKQVETKQKTEFGTVSTRMVKKWRYAREEAKDPATSKIPAAFWIIDEALIGKQVRAGVTNIPDIVIYEEPTTSVR